MGHSALSTRQSTIKQTKLLPSKKWRANIKIGKSALNWGKSNLSENSIIPTSSSSNKFSLSQKNFTWSSNTSTPICTRSTSIARRLKSPSHKNKLSKFVYSQTFAVSACECAGTHAQERLFPPRPQAWKHIDSRGCAKTLWFWTGSRN
jgi:hypothetical protein